MRRKNWIRMWMPLAGLWLSAALGCEGDKSTEPEAAAPPADVDGYVENLPAWEEFSPRLPDTDEPVGDPLVEEVEGEDGLYDCTTTPYSLTRTPEAIVTLNPDSEILWPGVLLQGDGHLRGIGSLAELPIRERAPLTVSVDLLTAENNRTVANPTLATVNQAVGELIEIAHNAGHQAGSRIYFDQVTTHSVDEAALRMGFSASYYDVGIKANLAASISAESRTVTASFTQQMFTVSTVLPSSPGDMFSDAFTEARLQREIQLGRMGPDNLPVFVSNVVYGRMLVFSLTSNRSETEIQSALSAIYNGGEFSAELSAEARALLEQAEINVVAVGGDAASAEALIRTGNLGAYFEEDAPLTSARPISYTIRNLADNTIATVSETTDYSLQTCIPEDVEATGAVYEIDVFQVAYLERKWFCAPNCDAMSGYDFWIEDAAATTKAAEWWGVSNFCSVGTVKDLKYNGGPTRTMEVSLHFDGRDQARIYGTVKILDRVVNLDYNVTLRGAISTGVRGQSRWTADTCRRYGIKYRVTKVRDLFD